MSTGVRLRLSPLATAGALSNDMLMHTCCAASTSAVITLWRWKCTRPSRLPGITSPPPDSHSSSSQPPPVTKWGACMLIHMPSAGTALLPRYQHFPLQHPASCSLSLRHSPVQAPRSADAPALSSYAWRPCIRTYHAGCRCHVRRRRRILMAARHVRDEKLQSSQRCRG